MTTVKNQKKFRLANLSSKGINRRKKKSRRLGYEVMYMSLKDCLSVRGRQVNFRRMHMELDVEDRLKGS